MTFLKFFKSSTFLYAATGAILLWAALPPVDFWPLAWIAPIPWIALIRRKELAGPRPYLAIWTAGFGFWLAALHWLRLPHPATCIGWLALSFYFAFYVPVFIGLSRIAVHQLRIGCHWHLASAARALGLHWQDASGTRRALGLHWQDASGTRHCGLPVILVAPVVWTGLELARAHLLTGMSMADIAHTQYRWIELIQIADLAGEYGVTFLIVFVAACFARMLPCENSPRAFWPLAPATALAAATLGYGYWRTADVAASPGPRIAIIQGSIDAQFGGDERQVRDKFYNQYFELSRKAVTESVENHKKLDLIVWPEIFFKERLISNDPDAGDNYPAVKKGNLTGKAARDQIRSWAAQTERAFAKTTNRLRTPILVGLDTQHFTADGMKFFNSAAYISKTGKLLGRYDKMHLVMFGEYTPFADLFPWIYESGLTPLSGDMTPGREPVAFDLEFTPDTSPRPLGEGPGVRAEDSLSQKSFDLNALTPNPSPKGRGEIVRIAPNICYESVLSHVIRKQINRLQEKGRTPDVLINLSNDGWFWGSSELDMHFACGVFRAVECRKPFLIAANTGFSAWIDGSGRVLAKGPRRKTDTLSAEVQLDSRRSLYLRYGDWPAGICLAACISFAADGFGHWLRRRRKRETLSRSNNLRQPAG